jgi:UMF1 family MFS transporter
MEKERKRAQLGWYLYDFGNSAYAAVILLAIYSAYFKGTVVGGAEGSRLWGISVGIAMLVAAIVSPILAVIADYSAFKKRFLFFFSALSWMFTGLLFFVQKGDVFLGMFCFIMAEIGYRAGQVFYNSLLTEVAEPHEIGRVSANGWAIGGRNPLPADGASFHCDDQRDGPAHARCIRVHGDLLLRFSASHFPVDQRTRRAQTAP